MSAIDNDETLVAPDELTTLKARADLLGIAYHPSIGIEKLRDKVNSATVGEAEKQPEVPAVETENQLRMRLRQEALALVRIRVTCMNPAKKEWEGEYFTTGNAYLGSMTKYVPFNIDEGWHVPKMIYDQLKDRQCQVFTAVRDARGNTIRKGKLIKEFSIEVLPPLTTEELQDLAQRQAISKSIE